MEAFCAAIAEFADAVLNRRSEPTAIAQQRLYCIVKHALNGKVPSEAVVSRLMGVTELRALGMIQTVTNHYRSKFEKGYVEAAKTAFVSKETVKDAESVIMYRFNAPQVVVDYLKEVISALQGGKLAPIQRVRGSAEIFEVSKDA